jgi:hypothetical protein
MPETRHKRAARIIPGMVLESVGSSTLGMDEISLLVSGNLTGAYSTGPRCDCDIRCIRAWVWNFARRAREGGLPRPRAYARQGRTFLLRPGCACQRVVASLKCCSRTASLGIHAVTALRPANHALPDETESR